MEKSKALPFLLELGFTKERFLLPGKIQYLIMEELDKFLENQIKKLKKIKLSFNIDDDLKNEKEKHNLN